MQLLKMTISKNSILTVLSVICCRLVLGQMDPSVKILANHEVDSIFTQSIRNELGVEFDVFRVYEYTDQAGKHFLILTENSLEEVDDPEKFMPIKDKISGVMVTELQGRFRVDRRMFDFTLPDGNEVVDEDSIWFWTKYFTLFDVDGDGLIDPILVYGTGETGINYVSNGRIKILVYHKGLKRAIRHQNGTLDWERKTRIDSMFYKLPESILEKVTTIMVEMEENRHAIFTAFPSRR